MKNARYVLAGALQGLVLALGISIAAHAADKPEHKDLVLKGDAKCTRCHDETDDYPVLAIAKTPHGVQADARTPTCTSCHGESQAHLDNPGGKAERPPVDRVFGLKSPTPPDTQNSACLTCHQSGLRMDWQGSLHQSAGVPCANCHRVHAPKDKVLAKATQPQVCFACHKEQRAQAMKPSHHPILEGKVVCSSCHNPHGGIGPHNLAKATVNEVCYTCHAEKRGPFLWEHPPVREDCTNCHVPHGSIHTPLLKARGPWLCQECHLAQYHPSTAYNGQSLPPFAPAPAQQLIANNCLNCHSQVHGSNHPSGPRKTR